MNSVAGAAISFDEVTPYGRLLAVSPFRLYTLRTAYLVRAAGVGVYVWPAVNHNTNEFEGTRGIQVALLVGFGATDALGLRYSVQMLSLLLFELIRKAICLIAVALQLWSAHEINGTMAEDIKAILMVVSFIPLMPWAMCSRITS